MASKKQFGGLWGDEESVASGKSKGAAASTNLSGSNRFSTRDFAVDQSVNLMAMGEESGTNLSGATRQSGVFASTVAGLFRGSTGTGSPPVFNEYGDAAASNESEEYISDKQRRMTPLVASIRNFVATKKFYALMLALLGLSLVGGGIYLASSKTDGSDWTGFASDTVDAGSTEEEMQDYIVNNHVTHALVFEGDPSSPQIKAVKWLAHEDPAKIKPGDKGFLDRYVLAVFYYGTNYLEGWDQHENWMTQKGVCSWAGVKCAPIAITASSENGFKTETQFYDANDAIISLILPGNNIEGVIPGEFAGLTELLTLDLSGNSINGRIPTRLGDMPKIRDLILNGNTIIGTFPSELTKLKGLHQLYLGENQLEGPIPESIQNMVNMRSLSLSSNSFEGSIPNFKPLQLMLKLHLDNNQLDSSLPEGLYFLTELRDLRLSKNNFNGPFPPQLSSLRNLEILRLDQNSFTGTVPEGLFDSIPRISDLQLQSNQLQGTIPRTLWHLQGLKNLALYNNTFTGTISKSIGTLVDVVTVSLQFNKLEGSIPSAIGKLDDIAVLTLESNKLTGSLPSELGECFRLETLTLGQNLFTGEIPSELGKLDRLTELQLELNNFEGVSVPPELCALQDHQLKHLSSDCETKMTCACCTQCV